MVSISQQSSPPIIQYSKKKKSVTMSLTKGLSNHVQHDYTLSTICLTSLVDCFPLETFYSKVYYATAVANR
jgi:hypothetical protein